MIYRAQESSSLQILVNNHATVELDVEHADVDVGRRIHVYVGAM